MIRHIVLVRFASKTSDDEKAAIFAELDALRAVVPGMRHFAGGSNTSPEGLGNGFSQAFTVDFDDAVARDAYLVHPAHRAAGERLVRAADGGIAGLVVVDIAFEA